MKAEEIRGLQAKIEKSLHDRQQHPLTANDETGLGICFWLAEIALQLAIASEQEAK